MRNFDKYFTITQQKYFVIVLISMHKERNKFNQYLKQNNNRKQAVKTYRNVN